MPSSPAGKYEPLLCAQHVETAAERTSSESGDARSLSIVGPTRADRRRAGILIGLNIFQAAASLLFFFLWWHERLGALAKATLLACLRGGEVYHKTICPQRKLPRGRRAGARARRGMDPDHWA